MVHHPSQTPEVSSRKVLVNGLRENTLIKHAQVYIYMHILHYKIHIFNKRTDTICYVYYTEMRKGWQKCGVAHTYGSCHFQNCKSSRFGLKPCCGRPTINVVCWESILALLSCQSLDESFNKGTSCCYYKILLRGCFSCPTDLCSHSALSYPTADLI